MDKLHKLYKSVQWPDLLKLSGSEGGLIEVSRDPGGISAERALRLE